MAGAALSRLWDTHPRLACVLQTLICLMVTAFFVPLLLQEQKNRTLIVILGAFLVIEVGTLAMFTWEAVDDGWAPSDY